MAFILSHMYILTPLLNLFGFGLKKTSKVHNSFISSILLVTGWLICTVIGKASGADWFTAIIKFGGLDGTIFSGASVLLYDLFYGVWKVIKYCLKREFLIFF